MASPLGSVQLPASPRATPKSAVRGENKENGGASADPTPGSVRPGAARRATRAGRTQQRVAVWWH
jgi:hypothetical protein